MKICTNANDNMCCQCMELVSKFSSVYNKRFFIKLYGTPYNDIQYRAVYIKEKSRFSYSIL